MGMNPTIRVESSPLYIDSILTEGLVARPSRIQYSDLNQVNPGINPVIIDMEAVLQGIRNLFSTRPGERLFRPQVGTNLLSVIFQPIDNITSQQIKQLLITAVELWEPRVSIDRRYTKITPVPEEEGYDIVILYKVAGVPDQTFEYRSFYEVLR
jgi:phage baseplate assembly protein W